MIELLYKTPEKEEWQVLIKLDDHKKAKKLLSWNVNNAKVIESNVEFKLNLNRTRGKYENKSRATKVKPTNKSNTSRTYTK